MQDPIIYVHTYVHEKRELYVSIVLTETCHGNFAGKGT